MRKVLITGSRDYHDVGLIFQELDALRAQIGDFMLIEGGATGADQIGRQWARTRGLPVVTVEANWSVYRKAAGHIRNGWMVSLEPDHCVAFPLATSRGTYDCIRQVNEAGIQYKVVGF
jgi:hypothetical protein